MKQLRSEKTRSAILTCERCAGVYPNEGPFALRLSETDLGGAQPTQVYTVELACPTCNGLRIFVALPIYNIRLYTGRGRKATARGGRVASSMRWDPDLHAWLAAAAARRGGYATMADIANEAVRAYMEASRDR